MTEGFRDQWVNRQREELRRHSLYFDAVICPPKWQAIDPADAPAWAGCYALYLDGQLAYIGQTAEFRTRFSAHGWKFNKRSAVTKWGKFKKYALKIRPEEDPHRRRDLEQLLIRRLRPQFNRPAPGDRVILLPRRVFVKADAVEPCSTATP